MNISDNEYKKDCGENLTEEFIDEIIENKKEINIRARININPKIPKINYKRIYRKQNR